MRNEQYTAKGETFVMEEDPSRDGSYRPIVIRTGYKRRSWNDNGWRSYRSYHPYRQGRSFGYYKGYIPNWYRDLQESRWDRWKLIGITALVSPVVLAKLPLLLKVLLEP